MKLEVDGSIYDFENGLSCAVKKIKRTVFVTLFLLENDYGFTFQK